MISRPKKNKVELKKTIVQANKALPKQKVLKSRKTKKQTAPLITDIITTPTTTTRRIGFKNYLKKIPTLKLKQRYRLLIIFCLIIAAILFNLLLRFERPINIQPTLSQTEINLANFPIYYPLWLPTGYKIDPKKTTVQPTLLFVEITNGQKTINLSEQPMPLKVPAINKLPSYVPLKTKIGSAVIGINYGTPSVIINTQGTLININTANGVNKTELTKVIQDLKPLNNLPTN